LGHGAVLWLPDTALQGGDMADENVVDFANAKWAKDLERKDEKVQDMRERFAAALPDKKHPVKDFLRKKKAKKKH
jgi:hypothetical protein